MARLDGDIALGVADCPDEQTAKAVLDAMRDRDESTDKGDGFAPMLSVADLELSTRARKILAAYWINRYGPNRKQEPITTLGELAAHTRDDLLIQRHCGRTTVLEFEQKLEQHGLSFAQ